MTEMERLTDMLTTADIPFDRCIMSIDNSIQICYPMGPAMSKNCVCDVICNRFSMGGSQGLLEIMGLVKVEEDIVEGYLTADEVFSRIQEHYKQLCNEITT